MKKKESDFNQIYKLYSNGVFRYLLMLTQDRHLSEELTQETFYQAIKSINSFNGNCSIYTWLCAIAKNSFRTYLRKNKKYLYTDDIEIMSEPMQFSPSQESHEALYNAISKLKSPYREIVQLHVFDNVSLKQIAIRLGKSESFARVAFHRAKNMLRKEIKKDEL